MLQDGPTIRVLRTLGFVCSEEPYGGMSSGVYEISNRDSNRSSTNIRNETRNHLQVHG